MTTKVPAELSSTPSIVDNGNATAITIDSSENVGIANTSPVSKLDVTHTTTSNTGDSIASFGTSGSGGWANSAHQVIVGGPSVSTYTGLIIFSDSTSGNGQLSFADGKGATDSWRGSVSYNHANDFMKFDTNANEVMRFTSAGHVGIGTTSPNSDLHVKSPDDSTAAYISGGTYALGIDRDQASGTNYGWYFGTTGSNTYVVYDGAGTGRFEVSLSSAGFISDRDQKENITDIPYGLDTVKKLKPKKFKFKDVIEMVETDGEKRTLEGDYNIGFIAQEMVEEVPEIVSGTDGQGDMKIDYAAFSSVLTKAIQEQQTIIEDLKARIETLEGG